MSAVTGACRACFNCKKYDDEELADYNRCFKVAIDILYLRVVGPILVSKSLQEIYHTDA